MPRTSYDDGLTAAAVAAAMHTADPSVFRRGVAAHLAAAVSGGAPAGGTAPPPDAAALRAALSAHAGGALELYRRAGVGVLAAADAWLLPLLPSAAPLLAALDLRGVPLALSVREKGGLSLRVGLSG